MNYGHLSRKRKTDNGYGLPWMSAEEKLLVYILENARGKVQKACGIHCLQFTVSVRFHILISGVHMQKFFHPRVIGLSQKTAVKQVILND